MHDVFISYSTKDHNQADTVRSILEKNGIKCWMAPRDIPTGSNYTKEIPIAIRGCQVFVLILSRNSQNSHWVLKELDSAVNCGKVILPFMLENCQLNDEFNFLLTGAQRYEAYQKKADTLQSLITRIRAITNSQPEESTQTPPPRPMKEKDIYLGSAQCPACSGIDLEELTKKTGSYTLGEKTLGFLPPIFCIIGLLAGVLGMAILLSILDLTGSSISNGAMTFGAIGGAVLGFILGKHKSGEIIRRQRIRRGLNPHPFRCKTCQKEFLAIK